MWDDVEKRNAIRQRRMVKVKDAGQHMLDYRIVVKNTKWYM